MLIYVGHQLPAFQSTLPRGSDAALTRQANVEIISIHAPSRERLGHINNKMLISSFQSTLPRGSDKAVNNAQIKALISIHAPSRERPALQCGVLASGKFQSTLPRGSDVMNMDYLIDLLSFQSTLPRGSDSLRRVRAQRMA